MTNLDEFLLSFGTFYGRRGFLYRAYVKWCDENKTPPLSKKSFFKQLKKQTAKTVTKVDGILIIEEA